MPNLVAQVKRAINDSDTALVADLYDAKFCTPAETVALLHFDDPDNPLKDECGNEWVEGDYLAQTSSGNIGGAVYSTRTGTTSSVVYVLGNRSFYLGGQDYTVDFWGKGRVNLRINGNEGHPVVLWPKGFEYPKNGVYTFNNVFSGDSNSWRHYAIVYNYSANTLSFYENGVKKGTVTPSKLERQRRKMLLGYNINKSYPAYYSEFRIVDGLQVWTSNFTPPTEPYKLVDGHIPCRLQGSNQRLWAPFNFIKTDLTPADSVTA